MNLHREGYKILRNEILIFLIVNYITYWYSEILFWYFTLPISVLLFVMSVYFFRVPKRNFERKEGNIYAPCDGKVVVMNFRYLLAILVKTSCTRRKKHIIL